MEKLFQQYRAFREDNIDYFKYCQKTANEIAEKLISADIQYQQLVNQFEAEIHDKRQELSDVADKLEELREKVVLLDKTLKEDSMKFEQQYNEFEHYKRQLKQKDVYKKLNQLDEEILTEFEKTLQDPRNIYHKSYMQEAELLQALKNAQPDKER